MSKGDRDRAMNAEIKNALNRDRTIDIITTGAKSGLPRRTEIWFTNVDGRIIICGTPGATGDKGPRTPRDWLANLKANPAFTFCLKESLHAELPARAVEIVDPADRRYLMSAPATQWYRDQVESLEELVQHSPIVEVFFDENRFASIQPATGNSLVTTLIGTGTAGYSDQQVNNPYGLVLGPDGALYFCDLDNQRIRRLDLKTRQTTTIAGNGERAYTGDGGPAVAAALNMPHEIQFDAVGNLYIAERDNHVIRKVDAKSHLISTFAGTGTPGFSGDGGPAARAQLRQPHSIAVHPDQRRLLVCDIGNHRVRQIDFATSVIEPFGGTGERQPTAEGAPIGSTPLNGPRTITFDRAGNLYLALREGNAIYWVNGETLTIHHVAGTGEQGHTGDGGQARTAQLAGPKGLAWSDDALYVADTENHVIRKIDLKTGIIQTILGTGQRGDGPEPEPLRCALARPHGVLVDKRGVLYVGDSEAHRIRALR